MNDLYVSQSTPTGAGTASAAEAESEVKLDWKTQKEEQARIRKRQNDLKKVEDEIHKLETRDGEIDELLTQEEIFTDVAKLMELNKEKEGIRTRLEPLYKNGKSWQNNLSAVNCIFSRIPHPSFIERSLLQASNLTHISSCQTKTALRQCGGQMLLKYEQDDKPGYVIGWSSI